MFMGFVEIFGVNIAYFWLNLGDENCKEWLKMGILPNSLSKWIGSKFWIYLGFGVENDD